MSWLIYGAVLYAVAGLCFVAGVWTADRLVIEDEHAPLSVLPMIVVTALLWPVILYWTLRERLS